MTTRPCSTCGHTWDNPGEPPQLELRGACCPVGAMISDAGYRRALGVLQAGGTVAEAEAAGERMRGFIEGARLASQMGRPAAPLWGLS